MKRLLLAIAAGGLLTVVFFVIGAFYSGGGHTLTAITIFFPYSGLVSPSLKDTHWEFLAMILLLAQFPAYALIIAYSGRRRSLVAIVILLAHMVAAVIALQVYESSRPRYGLWLPTVAARQLIEPPRRQRSPR